MYLDDLSFYYNTIYRENLVCFTLSIWMIFLFSNKRRLKFCYSDIAVIGCVFFRIYLPIALLLIVINQIISLSLATVSR